MARGVKNFNKKSLSPAELNLNLLTYADSFIKNEEEDAGYAAIVEELLNKGADINVVGVDGMTPLILAAFNCKPMTVAVLLDHNPNINVTDKHGRTAAYYACRYDEPQILKDLLAKGADANTQSARDGATLLHAAIISSTKSCIDILLNSGQDINFQLANTDGKTALDYARDQKIDDRFIARITHSAEIARQNKISKAANPSLTHNITVPRKIIIKKQNLD